MKRSKPVATVFIDANIFKFAAIKRHVYHPRQAEVVFGRTRYKTTRYERYTQNKIFKVKKDSQKRDVIILGVLAYAGISNWLQFYCHPEVDIETWGLPGMASSAGRFFGCPVHRLSNPEAHHSRIVAGGGRKLKEHTLEYLTRIENPRYIELLKMTGAFQGKDRPLNLNQALDAYHLWCAEVGKMEYFLTMDEKLRRMVERSGCVVGVKVVGPHDLLVRVVPKFGFSGALVFLWKGFRFAKVSVGFPESSGWH